MLTLTEPVSVRVVAADLGVSMARVWREANVLARRAADPVSVIVPVSPDAFYTPRRLLMPVAVAEIAVRVAQAGGGS